MLAVACNAGAAASVMQQAMARTLSLWKSEDLFALHGRRWARGVARAAMITLLS